MDNFSFLSNSDLSTIEKLYQDYLQDPNSVEDSWRKYFEGFNFALKNFASSTEGSKILDKEFKVINLIKAYRQRGHLFTETNPVRTRRKYFPTLDFKNFDLEEEDLETTFQAGNEIGIGPAKLKDIIIFLKQTYCQSIGAEYVDIRKPEMVTWFQGKMEGFYHLILCISAKSRIIKVPISSEKRVRTWTGACLYHPGILQRPFFFFSHFPARQW